jgi:hypothetical protein
MRRFNSSARDALASVPEREAGVLRVEEPVDDGAAGSHPLRELCAGHAIALHLGQDLIREDLLLRPQLHLLPDAGLVEE